MERATTPLENETMESCCVCLEEVHRTRVVLLTDDQTCADLVCFACLDYILTQALKYEAHHPPAWGGMDIDVDDLYRSGVLPKSFMIEYKAKEAEYRCPPTRRIYCCWLTRPTATDYKDKGKGRAEPGGKPCEAFLGERRILDVDDILHRGDRRIVVYCPDWKCERPSCLVCGEPVEDDGSDSSHRCVLFDAAAAKRAVNEAFKGLQQGREFQICPNDQCGRRVALLDGCNHMTCKCSTEFCFICGKPATLGQDHWAERSGRCPRFNQPGTRNALYDPPRPRAPSPPTPPTRPVNNGQGIVVDHIADGVRVRDFAGPAPRFDPRQRAPNAFTLGPANGHVQGQRSLNDLYFNIFELEAPLPHRPTPAEDRLRRALRNAERRRRGSSNSEYRAPTDTESIAERRQHSTRRREAEARDADGIEQATPPQSPRARRTVDDTDGRRNARVLDHDVIRDIGIAVDNGQGHPRPLESAANYGRATLIVDTHHVFREFVVESLVRRVAEVQREAEQAFGLNNFAINVTDAEQWTNDHTHDRRPGHRPPVSVAAERPRSSAAQASPTPVDTRTARPSRRRGFRRFLRRLVPWWAFPRPTVPHSYSFPPVSTEETRDRDDERNSALMGDDDSRTLWTLRESDETIRDLNQTHTNPHEIPTRSTSLPGARSTGPVDTSAGET